METWNAFYGNEVFIGLLGAAGLLSMIAVVFTASSNVDKREQELRVKRELALQKKIQEALDSEITE